MRQVVCREMKAGDASWVLGIFEKSIEEDDATYVTECPSWEEWDQEHDQTCRMVAEYDGQVIGFAVVSDVFVSSAYAGVGEISIYVDAHYRKRGVGSMLLKSLIGKSEELDERKHPVYYMLQARIFTNNEASIALHNKEGFRRIGYREKILKKKGIWRDVYVYERRSRIY